MILFTKNDFIYKNVVCDGDGRKTAKKLPVWLSSHSPFYDNGADCFSSRRDLIYRDKNKKTGLDAVRTGSMNLYKWDSKIFRKSGLQ